MDTINLVPNAPKSKMQSAADRFIPHRVRESVSTTYDFTISVFEMEDIWPPKSRAHLNYARKFFARQSYVERLRSMFELKSRNKVLNFSENNSFEDTYQSEVWPVIKRKQPLIKYPEIILDTPSLDTHLFHNMIDWSKQNHIAVVHGQEIFIWRGEKEKSISVGRYNGIKQCIKFDHEGTRLAIALNKSRIGIIDVSTDKICYSYTCCKAKACRVSSFAWSKTGMLISGCSKGKLGYWLIMEDVHGALYCAHKDGIIGMQLSCNENYLATSGLDSNVRIWSFPEIKHINTVVGSRPIKVFAWHPWHESIFVGSADGTSSISVWNIHSCKMVYKTISCNAGLIDCITFNARSGELVVSVHEESSKRTFIAVIPNFTSLSDGIIWHIGRVPYLLWNNDSTKLCMSGRDQLKKNVSYRDFIVLVTAGSDEYVCIWNFFGIDNKSIPKLRNKKEKLSNGLLECLTGWLNEIV